MFPDALDQKGPRKAPDSCGAIGAQGALLLPPEALPTRHGLCREHSDPSMAPATGLWVPPHGWQGPGLTDRQAAHPRCERQRAHSKRSTQQSPRKAWVTAGRVIWDKSDTLPPAPCRCQHQDLELHWGLGCHELESPLEIDPWSCLQPPGLCRGHPGCECPCTRTCRRKSAQALSSMRNHSYHARTRCSAK